MRGLDENLARRTIGVYSPDRRFIVTSAAGDVVIRDAMTGEHVRTCKSGDANASRFVFTPDDRIVIAGTDGGDVYCWDVETGTLR
jgi:WD40 repeat protein